MTDRQTDRQVGREIVSKENKKELRTKRELMPQFIKIQFNGPCYFFWQ